MKKQQLHFETLQVHAGQTSDPTTGSCAVPIHQTTAYTFESAEQGAALFALEQPGYIYTRPEQPPPPPYSRSAWLPSKGVRQPSPPPPRMAAQMLAVTNLAAAGDNLVSTSFLYGGTTSQFKYTLHRNGHRGSVRPGRRLRRASPR